MIQEVVKICGLDIDTIRLKLSEFLGMGVTFDVEEKCLDAKITMTSAGTRESFDQIKAKGQRYLIIAGTISKQSRFWIQSLSIFETHYFHYSHFTDIAFSFCEALIVICITTAAITINAQEIYNAGL